MIDIRLITIFDYPEELSAIEYADRIVREFAIKDLYVGIDPGKEGAWFGYADSHKPVFCCDVPKLTVVKKKARGSGTTERKIYDRRRILRACQLLKALSVQCNLHLMMETPIFPAPRKLPICCSCGQKHWTVQHNSPQSTAEQWGGWFILDAFLYASGVTYKSRTPVAWQKLVFGATAANTPEAKDKARQLAIETFGDGSFFYGTRGGMRQDRFDAAAISIASSVNEALKAAENKVTLFISKKRKKVSDE